MKIGVIGANGKAGRMMVGEAQMRGHEVTAYLRDSEKMPGATCGIVEKDLYNLIPEDFKGLDAVISAFGLPFGGEHPTNAYQNAYAHLIKVFEQLPNIRLLVVGGASSLYQDETKQKKVIEMFPESIRKDPQDMINAFEDLKKSNVKYTYFSPATFFDSRGIRTGKYNVSEDVAIKNASGESFISYADYAVAMIDEVEQGNHIRKRFTAVSDSRRPNKNSPYYGIKPERPEYEGLSQYRDPFNYELIGQTLRLVMDDGKKYSVEFLNGHTLRWAEVGQSGTVEHYDCAKGAENVYFVNFEFSDRKPRTNLTLIADLSERLVTLSTAKTNYHIKFNYMTETTLCFGVLDVPGVDLPDKRHKYTADLMGKRIHWHYAPDVEIVHVYYATDYIRTTMPQGASWGGMSRDEWDRLIQREPYDEPASYVKMKNGLYIVACDEQNMSRRGWTGNSLLFLIDTVRVHDVGRSFGHAGMDTGKIRKENYIFGAYGSFVYSDGILEAVSNRYRK